jgi:hypothetical protein
MKTRITLFSIFVVLLLHIGTAYAQPSYILKGPHNGLVKVSGPYHLELVASKNELSLYITDKDWRPSDTQGMLVQALLMVEPQNVRLDLVQKEGYQFVVRGNFPMGNPLTVMIRFKLPDRLAKYIKFQWPEKATDVRQH